MPFKEAKVYHSNFYTYKGDHNAGTHIAYLYKADIKNISSDIFENVSVRLGFELHLSNGTILRDNDMRVLSPLSKLISYWQPSEVHKVNEIDYLIPVRFADYPVDKVILLLNFRFDDLVNGRSDEVTGERDVTELWKKAVARVRNDEWQLTSPFDWDNVGTSGMLPQAKEQQQQFEQDQQTNYEEISEEEQASMGDAEVMLEDSTESTSH